tara:strand:+ start:491 stop:883 length:393 start_codon:yes stop_codon:yes gene_type:complete
MKKLVLIAILVATMSAPVYSQAPRDGTFGSDLSFLQKHKQVVVLRSDDDGRTRADLLEHLRTAGDELKKKVLAADPAIFAEKQPTPFLAEELPTVGDLLAHVFTTHIALHMGQLSQIRRESGFPSWYQTT